MRRLVKKVIYVNKYQASGNQDFLPRVKYPLSNQRVR